MELSNLTLSALSHSHWGSCSRFFISESRFKSKEMLIGDFYHVFVNINTSSPLQLLRGWLMRRWPGQDLPFSSQCQCFRNMSSSVILRFSPNLVRCWHQLQYLSVRHPRVAIPDYMFGSYHWTIRDNGNWEFSWLGMISISEPFYNSFSRSPWVIR